jgi:hypothetical protein
MYNATAHLGELYAPGRQLCFYPSCGNRFLSPLIRLRSDVFVFSDYYPRSPAGRRGFWRRIVGDFSRHGVPLKLHKATRSVRVARSGEKWIFLFFMDNNTVLERIAGAGWKIAQFVGFNDGCCEGGNYECVHTQPFLDKLLPVMQDGADYFTDHSETLTLPNPPLSTRSHALYRNRFVHSSGRRLYLSRILIVRQNEQAPGGQSIVPRPEVFEPAVRTNAGRPSAWREIGEASALELQKLSPFRTLHQFGIIAHYHVTGIPEAVHTAGSTEPPVV